MEFLQDAMIKLYRDNVIGNGCTIETYNGERPLIYADWAATGRLYRTIEDKIINEVGQYYGNTHSVDSYVGRYINSTYERARRVLLRECGATEKYELLTGGAGATFALHRFQEILAVDKFGKVVVFISSFEHNTNYLTWLALGAEVVIVNADVNGNMNLNYLEESIKNYVDYDVIIGSFTACSNVTGIVTNYKEAIKVVRQYNGIGIVDYSAFAPHTTLDFSNEAIDAAYWGTHKFLGGPGGPGVLLYKKSLYQRESPSIPSGGTALWTDPKQRVIYHDEIYKREDPGTPAILQTIKAMMVHQLVNEMGAELIHLRESHFVNYLIKALVMNPCVHVFASSNLNRMPIISFVIDGLEYSTVTKALSDFYGIQARGGCSCAGIYAHELLSIDDCSSHEIFFQIKEGNHSKKPGWVRISFHAVMNREEITYIANSINEIAEHKVFFRNHYYEL